MSDTHGLFRPVGAMKFHHSNVLYSSRENEKRDWVVRRSIIYPASSFVAFARPEWPERDRVAIQYQVSDSVHRFIYLPQPVLHRVWKGRDVLSIPRSPTSMRSNLLGQAGANEIGTFVRVWMESRARNAKDSFFFLCGRCVNRLASFESLDLIFYGFRHGRPSRSLVRFHPLYVRTNVHVGRSAHKREACCSK